MTSTRRWLLKTGTAAIVVIAAGGAGWALTRTAAAAREPWRAASRGFGDPRLDALAYAILAPNPHNLQPWQVRLESELQISVFCDPNRRLPATDPYDRQVVIGFGCFLEILQQAAAANGFRAHIDPFPHGEPQPRLDERPIATVTFSADPDVDVDPLFATVLTRRTCRLPFDTSRAVNAEDLAGVIGATIASVPAFGTVDDDRLARLRKLAVDAWKVEWANPATRRESIDVTRIGKAEINENPDGIYLEGALMEGLNTLGMLTREQMADTESRAFADSELFYADACRTAMAFAWTVTESNSRVDQLNAGHAWVRMQLAANASGLAFHPLSQALQEFPEMAEHYRQIHTDLGATDGQTVQMFARLGYAADVPAAPRWPLEARLLSI
ncbi:MAG: nitroreductase family protein [Pseudomonadota bacterium]